MGTDPSDTVRIFIEITISYINLRRKLAKLGIYLTIPFAWGLSPRVQELPLGNSWGRKLTRQRIPGVKCFRSGSVPVDSDSGSVPVDLLIIFKKKDLLDELTGRGSNRPTVIGCFYRGILPCFLAGITFCSLLARNSRLEATLARVSDGSMISEM